MTFRYSYATPITEQSPGYQFANATNSYQSYTSFKELAKLAKRLRGRVTDWPGGVLSHWKSPTFTAYWVDLISKRSLSTGKRQGRQLIVEFEDAFPRFVRSSRVRTVKVSE